MSACKNLVYQVRVIFSIYHLYTALSFLLRKLKGNRKEERRNGGLVMACSHQMGNFKMLAFASNYNNHQQSIFTLHRFENRS